MEFAPKECGCAEWINEKDKELKIYYCDIHDPFKDHLIDKVPDECDYGCCS